MVPDVRVACARIIAFAEQLQVDWETFAEHPFRHILSPLPPLQTRCINSCQCDKRHPIASDSSDVLLDVFRQQFFTNAGGSPHMQPRRRIQCAELLPRSYRCSSCQGSKAIYLEPRLPDASAPSDEFQAVWVPKALWVPQANHAMAQHQAQCEPMSLRLARTGRRFGIRVKAQSFQQLFEKLKREGQVLSPGTKQNW